MLEKRGLVKVIIAEGKFVITREELSRAGIAETNRALRLGVSKAQPDNDADNKDAKTHPVQFEADIVRDITLEAKQALGEEMVMAKLPSGKKVAKVLAPMLHLHIQYQSWDLPKEYWDRQSFIQFMLRIGTRVTAREGEELIASGHCGQQLCLVISGVVNIQVRPLLEASFPFAIRSCPHLAWFW